MGFKNDLHWAEEQQRKIDVFYKDKFASTRIADERERRLFGITRIATRANGSEVKIREVFNKRVTGNIILEVMITYEQNMRDVEKPSWFLTSQADILIEAFVEAGKITLYSYNMPNMQNWYRTEGKNRIFKHHIQETGLFKMDNILVPLAEVEKFKVFDKEEI